MRIGITGASGLIGSALKESLSARNDQVVIFSRNLEGASSSDVVRWDPARNILDEADLSHVGELDAIIHLAGAGIGDKRWNQRRKKEILASRVNSTALLAEAFTGRVGFFASGSAIGIYGSRGDEVLTEDSSYGNDFLAQVCIEWEAKTKSLETAGVPVAHLRTGIVQSTQGGALAKQLPLFRYGLGGKLGSGHQWLSPISIHDEVRAILHIIDNKLSGPVNLVCPNPLTNADFTAQLAHFLHRPAFANAPKAALSLALGREMAESLLLISQRITPNRLIESGFEFKAPNFQEILKSIL